MYKISDQVLCKRTELGKAKKNKLEPLFEGPYYIHEVLGQGTYKIRNPSGRILKKIIHGNQLKRYLPPLRQIPEVLI